MNFNLCMAIEHHPIANWFNELNRGRRSLEDEGRPKTVAVPGEH